MAYDKDRIMQQSSQPYFIVQNTNTELEEVEDKSANMELKELNWGKKLSAGNKSQNMDLHAKFAALLKEIREDLSNLRRLNYAIISAEHFNLPYKKENAGKEAEYKKDLGVVNDLSRGEKTEKTLNELQIISDRLDLDIGNFDTIFPQLIYSSVHLKDYMKITVTQIGYPELKLEAEAALDSLKATEKKLNLTSIMLSDEGSDKASISSVIHSINVLNEMQEHKNKILSLKEKDHTKGQQTRKLVLTGMATTLLVLTLGIISLYWNEVDWDDIRDFPILGIPFGICIWAFIGSFAAMLQQFYQKPIYEFGDTLKWVIIRPVLGVVMGSAIYLAFSNGFGVDVSTGNGGLSYLIAFFVGLSDSFTFGIIDRLQGALTSSIKDTPTPPQPVIMMPANTTLIPNTTVVEKEKEKEKPAVVVEPIDSGIPSNLSSNVGAIIDSIADAEKDEDGGEDEDV